MELGVFSVCMPEYRLDETVSLLKAIGYDAVEWRVAEIPDMKPEDFKLMQQPLDFLHHF